MTRAAQRATREEPSARAGRRLATAPRQEQEVDLFHMAVRRRIVHLYPSALLLRRSAIDGAGGFDLAMRCGEDDLFLRILARHPSAIAREPLVRIQRHDGNISDRNDYGGANAYEEHIVTMKRLADGGAIDRRLHDEIVAYDHHEAGSHLLRAGRAREARPHLRRAIQGLDLRSVKAALQYIRAAVPWSRARQLGGPGVR